MRRLLAVVEVEREVSAGSETNVLCRARAERGALAARQELTADRVKKLIEVVMKTHLGWLVVWGNIFGGLIGIAAEAVGY